MGSGVGLTGIAAAMYSQKVICTGKRFIHYQFNGFNTNSDENTDIDLGGILNLIEINVKRNAKLITNKMGVMELDFKNLNWPTALQAAIAETEIVLAADGKCSTFYRL